MYQPNQQPGIPYNQLLVAPMQFNPGSPPFVPAVQTSQSLAQYTPILAALCANEAAARVNVQNPSPIRVLFWNLIVQNNFQNDDFAMLVSTAADILLHHMVTQYQGLTHPDNAVGMVAVHANTICASNLFSRFPQMAQPQITPMHQLAEVRDVLEKASQLQIAVRNIKQQNGIGVFNPHGQQPQYGGMMMPQQQAVTYSQGQAMAPAGGQTFRSDARPPMSVSMPAATSGVHAPAQPLAAAVYDRNAPAPAPAAPVAAAVVQPIITAPTMTTPEKVDGYFQARNAGEDMDRKKHTIVTTAQRAFAGKPTNRANILEDSVNNLLSARQEIVELEVNPPAEPEEKEAKLKAIIDKHLGATASTSNVLFYIYLDATISEMRRMQIVEAVDGKPADLVQRTAIVAEPMVCSAQMGEKLREITQSRQLTEFAARLRQLMANPDNTLADRMALLQLDAYLTHEINSMLVNGLTLTNPNGSPALIVTSFADDVPPGANAGEEPGLVAYIAKKSGYKFERALVQNQGNFIASHCDTVSAEQTGEYVDESWGKDVVVFDRRYTITLLNMLASELNVDFVAPGGNAIMESEFPMLFRLIHDTIATYEDEGQAIACHLLVTADNQRFRMHRGLVGSKFVLLERLPR